MSSHPRALNELTNPVVQRTAELAQADTSLRRREALLAASAKASRLLLEAADAMKVMPEVLRLLGEAAEVDRTSLALVEIGPDSERWLAIKHEWLADGVGASTCESEPMKWQERKTDCFCAELRTGRSVFVRPQEFQRSTDVSIAGDQAKSSVIVPIMIGGEYEGAIGFDDCHEPREFDSAVVSALEIAAGLIGAALHRERLMATMRREREQAAEARVAQLANANATIRTNLEQLAGETDTGAFLEHVLLEATRQLDADSGTVVVLGHTDEYWHVVAHVREGHVEDPPFARSVRTDDTAIAEEFVDWREPEFCELEKIAEVGWPGVYEFHRDAGHQSVYAMPLVFGEQTVGFIGLAFKRPNPLASDKIELLVALAHQVTLAVGLERLARSAKKAAVLAERNRIGQEIHDGLAQGFTGILMQLGAAEEHMGCAKHSPLPDILNRIRALAREGLTEARRSVLALKPERSTPGSLELALKQLAERSTIAGRIAVTFDGGISVGGLPPEHQHELLRIAQEAVINAVRHAHAHAIRIVLIEEPTDWILMVIDDGRGMDELSNLGARQGFGLTNMRERASAIGGRCDVQSKVGKGTQVIVRLPRAAA